MTKSIIAVALTISGLWLVLFHKRYAHFTVKELHRMVGIKFPEVVYRTFYLCIGLVFAVGGILGLFSL
jgi:ABC-type Na+ efflux pump permease subunit